MAEEISLMLSKLIPKAVAKSIESNLFERNSSNLAKLLQYFLLENFTWVLE